MNGELNENARCKRDVSPSGECTLKLRCEKSEAGCCAECEDFLDCEKRCVWYEINRMEARNAHRYGRR